MNLEDVHLRTTRALQPLATATADGVLCFITDEGVIEQSDGTTWVTYSAAAVAGLNQLTGDVTAGPGGGSQVATIAANAITTAKILNDAITTAKILDAQITEIKLLLADNLTGNVSTTAHGFAPKLSNVATEFLNGVGAYSVPAGGGSEWTTTAVKSADQDVTNSSTLVDAADLVIAVLAGEVWLIEVLLIYAGDTTAGDFKAGFAVTAGTPLGVWHSTFLNTTGTAAHGPFNFSGASTPMKTDAVMTSIHAALMRGTVAFPSSGNLTFQFAQAVATPATSARCKAGTIMRGKKII